MNREAMRPSSIQNKSDKAEIDNILLNDQGEQIVKMCLWKVKLP